MARVRHLLFLCVLTMARVRPRQAARGFVTRDPAISGSFPRARRATTAAPSPVGTGSRPPSETEVRISETSRPMAQQESQESPALPKGETYESSDSASKGIVSSLTAFVNAAAPALSPFGNPFAPPRAPSEGEGRNHGEGVGAEAAKGPPTSPEELLERIRDDYVVRNYLWTGDLDGACFDADCLFNDPTLSFRGFEAYRRNVRGLRPIVEALTGAPNSASGAASSIPTTRSDLLSIRIESQEGYIETRWNMVGDLIRLPWKPRVDVVGRTKFWYQWRQPQRPITAPPPSSGTTSSASSPNASDAAACLVVHYDEEWEIPAYRALLQLITPSNRAYE